MADKTGPVWLKWYSSHPDDPDVQVFKACHSDVAGAQAQAAEEARHFIGIFDGPSEGASKIADAKGAGF